VRAKSAIERRIVVPIDAGNWMRALEIVCSSYARPGVEPKHYQQVIRCMTKSVTGEGSGCDAAPHRSDIALVLDRLREEFYEANCNDPRAVNVGVWITLVWAYCRLGCLQRAIEACDQLSLRFRLASGTKQHLAELLLPLCAAQGRGDEANHILTTLVERRTELIQQWLLEASGRSGHWEEALQMISGSTNSKTPISQLFFDDLSTSKAVDKSGPSRPQGSFSASALIAMCAGAAKQRRWHEALAFYSQWRSATNNPRPSSVTRSQALDALRHVLNALSADCRWVEALRVYQRHFTPDVPFDIPATNMLFYSFPESPKQAEYPQFENPTEVVACYHSLVFDRDDFVMSNWVSGVVAPCLVQLGQWARSLGVLRNAPLMLGKANKHRHIGVAHLSNADREAEQRLVRTVYALHKSSFTSLECHFYTLWQWPFAFPKEVFLKLPKRDEMPSLVATLLEKERASAEAVARTQIRDETSVYEELLGCCPKPLQQEAPALKLIEKSSSYYEKEQDRAIKANTVALSKRNSSDFFSADPHADPRPTPKELFDTASGWTYFSRGGSKAFTNLRGMSHPFTPRPNYMKAVYDVNRGWNPRVNSSFAHRTPLKKYRKNSAV
jgi:hypothetical protein